MCDGDIEKKDFLYHCPNMEKHEFDLCIECGENLLKVLRVMRPRKKVQKTPQTEKDEEEEMIDDDDDVTSPTAEVVKRMKKRKNHPPPLARVVKIKRLSEIKMGKEDEKIHRKAKEN